MKRLRLAFFIDSINWGGAEKSLMALLRNLDHDELDVNLYTMSRDGDNPVALVLLPHEVRHHYIPCRRSRIWLNLCRLSYYLRRQLLKCLQIRKHWAEPYWKSMSTAYSKLKEEYDVAVSYQQGMITYYVAEKVRAKKKIAWINSQLGAHDHDVRFSRKFYDKYDHVVAVCDTLKGILSESGYVDPSRLTTIYDIIDEDEIQEKAREICVIDTSHDWTFVTVARLAPEKNLDLAIDTANILRHKGIDFKWYIVGGGPMEPYLRGKITRMDLSEHIVLTGAQKNPYKYIKTADIYVQTSKSEGFGMTIAEAKILGCPVVSTNFPIIHDQIKDGENGMIAEMTPESVANKIICLIFDDSLRMSIEKKLSAEKRHTKFTETEKFIKLIHSEKDPHVKVDRRTQEQKNRQSTGAQIFKPHAKSQRSAE